MKALSFHMDWGFQLSFVFRVIKAMESEKPKTFIFLIFQFYLFVIFPFDHQFSYYEDVIVNVGRFIVKNCRIAQAKQY